MGRMSHANLNPFRMLAVAALLLATGCQSTGNSSESNTLSVQSPVEFERGDPTEDPAPLSAGLQTVYFDYDRSELRGEAHSVLRSNAQYIGATAAGNVVTVVGHCDERGSEEYNLALGERRAEVVKRYLVDLGISASRIQTVSFGESRPAALGEGEAIWSRNRRAELSLGTQQASH